MHCCWTVLALSVALSRERSVDRVKKLINWWIERVVGFFLYFSDDEKTRSLQRNKTRRRFEASVSRLISLNCSNCSDIFQNSKYCFNSHVWRHKMSLRKYDIKQAKPDSIHYFSIFNSLSWRKKLSSNGRKHACISWSFTTNSSITFVIAFDSIIFTMIKN